MNLHIAQTQGARVECSTIARTAFQLISAQNCAPVMGCVQNTLVCNYILTETFTTPGDTEYDSEPNYEFGGGGDGSTEGYQTLVEREDFMAAIEAAHISSERLEDLIMRAAEVYPNYIRKNRTLKRKIPGKLAVSIVFPRNFTWSRKTDVNPLLPMVKIVKGVIQPDSGPICKKTIGGCGGSAIHALWKMSPDLSMRVITELQFMTTVFISRIGFSIGISDCLPTENSLIKSTIQEAIIKCEMINDSNKDKDEKEMEIVGALNSAMGIAPILAKTKMNKGDRNALVIMKKSGAKGSDTNNGQISAFVGSQCIDGKRMPYMLSDGKRALPHFFIGDNSPEARGFVKNSYLDGLTYQETWFHAAAGRRGVVDTAMKSVTGDTKIMIDDMRGGDVKVVEIGPWIDDMLLKGVDEVKILGVDHDMELLEIEPVCIPTVDEKGNVSWGLITHITRHSPTDILYRIKTRYGREVIVTDSKSLLVWNFLYSKAEQVRASTVKVGDHVPVTMKLSRPPRSVLKGGGDDGEPDDCIKIALLNRKGIFCCIGPGEKIDPLLHRDLMIRGDIVLDEIISIESLPGDRYRYVYDLTVPSTTNFCLANGLHVVDTADSGYIQKKIVKKIEDCKVDHDGTVRDANRNIIQFLYGGDGFNAKELLPTKHTSQPFFINLQHVADQLNAEAELLNPQPKGGIGKLRVLKREEVDLMVSFIQVGSPGFQTEITERSTFNIKTILRICVAEIKIYEYMIPMFCRKIKDEFEEAKAKMGYMAGLVAASSIGEPTTQMSVLGDDRIPLKIVLPGGKERYYCGPIGDIIDELFDVHCSIIYHLGEDSIFSNPDVEVYVNTVDPRTSKCSWRKIEEISRHQSNGKLVKVTTRSGRIITTTLSHSHLKRCTDTGHIVPIRGDQLEVGHFIPVCRKLDNNLGEVESIGIEGIDYPLNFDLGWMFGAYLAEGHIEYNQIGITNVSEHFEKRCRSFAKKHGGKVRKREKMNTIYGGKKKYRSVTYFIKGLDSLAYYLGDNCGRGSENKVVPAFVFFAPEKFVSGLLRGYFDGDGNVNASRQLVRVASISRNLIETVALLLSRFGIFGTISIETKANRDRNEQPLITYIISRKYVSEFFNKIGSDFPSKIEEMQKIVDYNNRENVHSRREDVDVIPGIGSSISQAAKPLGFKDYSRTYKRHEKKAYTGRETIRKYIDVFEEKGAEGEHMEILKTAVNSDIVWDKIVSVEILKDPKTLVYDLGVTGNHTFMMQNGLFTHNTLNTFHSTGQSAKDVTLGVPRLKELLNVAKKPPKPTCSIYLVDDALKDNLTKRREAKEEELIKELDSEGLRRTAKLSTIFAEKTVKYFMKSFELRYVTGKKGRIPKSSPIGLISYQEYEPSWWVEVSKKLIGTPSIEPNVWVIIIDLDINLLYIDSITPAQIAAKIHEAYGDRDNAFHCIASPACIGQIEVYINFTEIGSYTRQELSGVDGALLTSKNIDYFTVRDVAVNLIESVVISGIKGITKTYVHQKPDTGEWTVDTQGTALAQLLEHPMVDSTRTISDNVWEVYRIFGIEAARKFLVREITKILSFDGTYINPRHIALLVDSMCKTGYPTSVNRDGISRDVGPLAKGMFEKAVENFAESAAFGEHDMMQGVSAAVMMGTAPFVGTGTVEIKDEETLPVIRY